MRIMVILFKGDDNKPASVYSEGPINFEDGVACFSAYGKDYRVNVDRLLYMHLVED